MLVKLAKVFAARMVSGGLRNDLYILCTNLASKTIANSAWKLLTV